MPPDVTAVGCNVHLRRIDGVVHFMEQGHAALLPRLLRNGRASRARVQRVAW